jgi:hypothetical protein
MGKITIKVTTTLNQGAKDESIGYRHMEFKYKYNPTAVAPVNAECDW